MSAIPVRRVTQKVKIGSTAIGGNEPVRVQSMTNTPTHDIESTTKQVRELAEAGSELVRLTVNSEEAARAVPEIRKKLLAAGCSVPLIGDFHYNGHLLLRQYPECAKTLDKYRINPGNVGRGNKKDSQFLTICEIARDLHKAIRIGVNSGSLDPELVTSRMEENASSRSPKTAKKILDECMILSALQSVELALRAGLTKDQIVVSAKTASPQELLEIYAELSRQTDQPLHLGLTEAGIGSRGIVASSVVMGILLRQGIGDTIRVSLTPAPGGSRLEEVFVAQDILQSLGLRSFTPTITSCPGCGRTANVFFQELAGEVALYVRKNISGWKEKYQAVERLTIAVMGCVVNGPGESQNADIGISLPGAGEEPSALLYADGRQVAILKGDKEEIAEKFVEFIEEYIDSHCLKK